MNLYRADASENRKSAEHYTLKSYNKAVLNYYNGDNTSTMDITLEGITTTGIPVTGKAEYEVK